MKVHNSFLLYKDNRELLEDLTNEEKGILFQALYDFACDGVEPDFKDRAVKVAYRTMRNSIERDDIKYAERCKKNQAIRQAAWNKNKDKNTNVYERIQTYTNDTDSDSESESESESVPDRGSEPDSGRGVAEGKPITADSKMQALMDEFYYRKKQANDAELTSEY